MAEVDRPEYWEDVYKRGEDRWDKGRPSPPIARMLSEGVLPKGSRVAVPGAGRGHEAILIAQQGHTVVALDFAPSAVAGMKEGAAKAGVTLDVRQDDVFELAKLGPFDAILEHTIFCAIDTGRRREYASVIHRSLRGGGVFFGLWYAHDKPGGPPWSTNEAEIRSTYGDLFAIDRLVRAPDSFPERKDNELEFVFRKV